MYKHWMYADSNETSSDPKRHETRLSSSIVLTMHRETLTRCVVIVVIFYDFVLVTCVDMLCKKTLRV